MDYDIWARMLKNGARVSHIPKYLGGFRWHETSKTTQVSKNTGIWSNPESKEITQREFPYLNAFNLTFWRYFYKFYQLLNLNYIKGYCDLKKFGLHKHWKDMASIGE